MEKDSSLVTCLTWVKRGVAKRNPHRVRLDTEELKSILEKTTRKLACKTGESTAANSGSTTGGGKCTKAKNFKNDEDDENYEDKDVIEKYGLDDYDDSEEEDCFGNEVSDPLGSLDVLVSDVNNEKDPYVTSKKDAESDEEELMVAETDNLLVTGVVESDAALLYVYVYNEEESNMYIHHEVILPSHPLTLEWLDFNPLGEDPGNYVAVGGMLPTIDIWDLDVVDCLEPVTSLGASHTSRKKKIVHCGHTDAVLGLSWNVLSRKHLASCSADYTVRVWDLDRGSVVGTLRHHQDKVQCVQWSPTHVHSLLSGSFDHSVKLYDARQENLQATSWTLDGEIERLVWSKFSQHHFYASTETGSLVHIDTRINKPLFQGKAHDSPITGLSCGNSALRPMIISGSSNGCVKVWNAADGHNLAIVAEQKLNVGDLQCLSGNPDSPFVFAFGGYKKPLVLSLTDNESVKRHFSTPTNETRSGSDRHDDIASQHVSHDATESSQQSSRIPGATKARRRKRKRLRASTSKGK